MSAVPSMRSASSPVGNAAAPYPVKSPRTLMFSLTGPTQPGFSPLPTKSRRPSRAGPGNTRTCAARRSHAAHEPVSFIRICFPRRGAVVGFQTPHLHPEVDVKAHPPRKMEFLITVRNNAAAIHAALRGFSDCACGGNSVLPSSGGPCPAAVFRVTWHAGLATPVRSHCGPDSTAQEI